MGYGSQKIRIVLEACPITGVPIFQSHCESDALTPAIWGILRPVHMSGKLRERQLILWNVLVLGILRSAIVVQGTTGRCCHGGLSTPPTWDGMDCLPAPTGCTGGVVEACCTLISALIGGGGTA
jgi:hypothetical protein